MAEWLTVVSGVAKLAAVMLGLELSTHPNALIYVQKVFAPHHSGTA